MIFHLNFVNYYVYFYHYHDEIKNQSPLHCLNPNKLDTVIHILPIFNLEKI